MFFGKSFDLVWIIHSFIFFKFKDWAIFLNRCKSLPSTITGTDFFYLDDKIRKQVNKYYDNYQTPISLKFNKFDSTYQKNFNIIYEKFFKNPIS